MTREGQLAHNLLACVGAGNTKRAATTIAAGASVDGSTTQQDLPLHFACFNGQYSMAAFLIEHGADVDLGLHQSIVSASGGHMEAVKGWRPLHYAAAKRFVNIARLLLEAGAAIDVTDTFGTTPLMTVCVGRGDEFEPATRAAIALELLEAGADASKTNFLGAGALHEAARIGDDLDLIDLLLSRAPAALNRTDSEGQTPLYFASASGKNNALRHLLRIGATQPRPPFSSAKCPLYTAAYHGHVNIVRTLLERGMEAINASPRTIASAMFGAVRGGHAGVLHTLLVTGGGQRPEYWGALCGGNVSMLHEAVAGAKPAIFSVLLAAGVDELALDDQGRQAEYVLNRRKGEKDQGKTAACCRILQRGPAFRALSWAWPPIEAGADVVAAGTAQRVSRSRLGVRVFRPKTKTFFVSLIGR